MDDFELLKKYSCEYSDKGHIYYTDAISHITSDTDIDFQMKINKNRYYDGIIWKKYKIGEEPNIVETDYDMVYEFDIGYLLTIAKKNNKFGIIDFRNNVILPFENDMIRYKCGVFIACKDGICTEYYSGLYTTNIKPHRSFNYLDMKFSMSNNYIAKKKSGWGILKKDIFKNEITESTPFIYLDMIEAGYDFFAKLPITDKWGKITNDNEILIPFEYDNLKITVNGYTITTIDNKEGLIDENNVVVIPNIYPINSIRIPYKRDLICVKVDDKDLVFTPSYGLKYQGIETWFESRTARRKYIDGFRNQKSKVLRKG